MARVVLTSAMAASLYRDEQWSACQIAEAYGITKAGAEARIQAGGVAGVQWCPIHHTIEELHMRNPGAVALMEARWGLRSHDTSNKRETS